MSSEKGRRSPSPDGRTPRDMVVTKAASTHARIEPPLDYSFYNIVSLQEIHHWLPRTGYSPEKTLDTECLDLVPRELLSPQDTYANLSKESNNSKSRSKTFKLNNNNLADLGEFKSVVVSLFASPEDLSWLDLSFNELSKVDEVLGEFPNLQILYLHGNAITDLNEIDKLSRLKSLRKLTLHGNPIETIKGYRMLVLSRLPKLQALDFSPVTKADRKTAETLGKFYRAAAAGKKKRKKDEE